MGHAAASRAGTIWAVILSGVLCAAVGLTVGIALAKRDDDRQIRQAVTAVPTISPKQRRDLAALPICAEALEHADLLAEHALPLASAAIDHGTLMEKLEDFINGKPGGLSGNQVYRLGRKQMEVMEEDGPDSRVHAQRYEEVRKRCRLK